MEPALSTVPIKQRGIMWRTARGRDIMIEPPRRRADHGRCCTNRVLVRRIPYQRDLPMRYDTGRPRWSTAWTRDLTAEDDLTPRCPCTYVSHHADLARRRDRRGVPRFVSLAASPIGGSQDQTSGRRFGLPGAPHPNRTADDRAQRWCRHRPTVYRQATLRRGRTGRSGPAKCPDSAEISGRQP